MYNFADYVTITAFFLINGLSENNGSVTIRQILYFTGETLTKH